MPVFFRQGCGGEGGGRRRRKDEDGGDERKGKNKQRMKADAEKHQLRTTAAGEPDRARRERRETTLEEGKDRKNPHWRNGGVEKKNDRSSIEASRQGETRNGRKRHWNIHAPWSLAYKNAQKKNKGWGGEAYKGDWIRRRGVERACKDKRRETTKQKLERERAARKTCSFTCSERLSDQPQTQHTNHKGGGRRKKKRTFLSLQKQ